MRPDRIIVGEVRGPEAFDMLQAMNTGHPGSMSTGHANSCPDMINRLALMILMNIQLPWEAIHLLIGSALDILVHLQRNESGGREIREITRVVPCQEDRYKLDPVFIRNPGGVLEHVDAS